jgi:DNA helicase IV
MQWRLLLRRVPTGSMTVVGDIAQSSSPSSARSWAGALDEVTSGRWRLAELRINYRTPGQVMRLASGLLTAHGLDSGTVTSAREGNWAPRWVQLAGDEEKLVAAACLDELVRARAEVGGGRQAVICPSPQAAALAETLTTLLADHPEGAQILPDLSVLTPAQAKGLEFDTVLVVDPMGVLTQHERGVNDLYVALTRPTQQLVICHYGQLPAGLDTPPAD